MKYQLVPYIVRVNVRGMAKESRPLDDLDAGGTLDLATELHDILFSHGGAMLKEPRTDNKRPMRIRIEAVGINAASVRTLSLIVSPGRTGIESSLVKTNGEVQQREFDDTELIPLRHYLLYKPGSKKGLLLAERVGGDGATTALRSLLVTAWNQRHSDLTLSIDVAGDEKIWDAALADRPVVKYRMTRSTTEDGRLQVTGEPAEYVLEAKPTSRGKRWSLKTARAKAKESAQSLKQVLLEDVSPVLAPDYEDPEEGAAALVDEGWSVAVQLELEGGQKPIVNVESNASITLTFPIIDGVEEPTSRPKDDDVLGAVKRLVKDGVLASWGIPKDVAEALHWVVVSCKDDIDPKKAVWTRVNLDGTDSTGAEAPNEEAS